MLEKWAKLRRRKGRIEAERDQAIASFKARFERQCAPFVEQAAERLTPVEDELAQLESAIQEALLGAKDRKGAFCFPHVTTGVAAATIATRTEREIDPHEFFKAFTLPERNTQFWRCFKVLVGKAEKLLSGAGLDAISRPRQTHTVQIKEL